MSGDEELEGVGRPRTVRRAVGLGTAVAVGAVALVVVGRLATTEPPASPAESLKIEDPQDSAETGNSDADDRKLTEAVVEFARSPSASTHAEIPFADDVALGLADALVRQVDASSLADPQGWVIDEELFRAYTGPFSALDLLAQDRPMETVVGQHPHCVSPPVPPPSGFEGHRRVSIQPTDGTSCLEWWTVDLFVAGDGAVEAVTMDLYEP